MKKYMIWLKTEYKRAAAVLPGLFLKAIIPLVFIGMILSYAQKNDAYFANERGQIGVAAPEGATTELALNFVESMGAVDLNFMIVRVEEEKIPDLIKEGEISAGVCVPENILADILYGENVELVMYVPHTQDIRSLLFEEIMRAGVGALTMAQGEIYTCYALLEKYGLDLSNLSPIYEEIDKVNLGIYLNRDSYFRIRQLSATENDGYTNYYVAAFFVLYCLLFGLMVSGYAKRGEEEQKILKKRLGIPYTMQYLGRMLVLMTILIIPVCAYFLMLKLPLFGGKIMVKFTPMAILIILLGIALSAVWILLLYGITENKKAAMLPIVIFALVIGYVSGCILPSSILPEIIKKISSVIPFKALRESMLTVLAGNRSHEAGTIVVLVLGIVILFLAGLLVICIKQKNFGGAKNHAKIVKEENVTSTAKTQRLPGAWASSLFAITLKRTLRTKSIWICLLVTLGINVALTGMEKNSEIRVRAVVYSEDERLTELIHDYDGLVDFEILNSKAAVEEQVLQNKAECGYILSEDMIDAILSGDGNWSVPVYENAGATMTEVVNEILFEKIFFAASTKWFENYLYGCEKFDPLIAEIGRERFEEELSETLHEQMHFGQTFGVKTLYVDEKEQVSEKSEGVSFYPGRIVAVLCVILCALIGIMQVISDKIERRIFKRNPALTTVFTILHPTLLGLLTAILIFLW